MKKSFLAVSACVALLLPTLAGCQNSEPSKADSKSSESSDSQSAESSNVNPAGVFPIVKEPIELTILALQDGERDRGENLFTKEVEAKTNIKINWMIAPTGTFQEKMNLMFASDDVADIIAAGPSATDRLSKITELSLAKQKMIIPLTDYYDNLSVAYKEAFEKLDGLRDYSTTPDGEIYSFPNVDGYLHIQYNNKLWINKVWLDTLNLDIPTTIDEFYQVMKAFKEQDANGNGDLNDEIPLSTCKSGSGVEIDGFLMNSFITTPQTEKMWLDDGKVIFSPTQDKYKEGLSFLNKLYDEGLMNPESFTQDKNTQVNVNENGEYPVIGAFLAQRPGYACDLVSEPNSKKWEQYISLPPLKGPDGTVAAAWNPYAMYQTGVGVITSACENPEAAFRLIDFVASSEMSVRNIIGIENVHWQAAAQGEYNLDGQQAAITTIPGTSAINDNAVWGQLIGCLNFPEMILQQTYPQDPYADDVAPLNGRQVVMYKGSLDHQAVEQSFESVLPELYYDEVVAEEMALKKTSILEYVNQSVVRFVTGDMSIDKDWDSYIKDLQGMGLDQYLAEVQAAYDASAFSKK